MIAFGPLYFLFKESDGVLLACVPYAYDFIWLNVLMKRKMLEL